MLSTASLSHHLQALMLAGLLTSCGGGGGGSDAPVAPGGGMEAPPASPAAPPPILTTTIVSAIGDRVLVRVDFTGSPAVVSRALDARREATAPPVGGTPIVVDPRVNVRLIGYAVFNIFNCQFIEGGSFSTVETVPVSPAHGALDFGTIINFVLGPTAGNCAGFTLPFTNAFYTWTDDQAPTGTSDPFSLHFVTTSGTQSADTNWEPTVRVLPVDQEKDTGGCLADDPRQCMCPAPKAPAPCNEAGNPAMISKGNKFQAEFDFAAAAHTGIDLTRYYNSNDPRVSAFGRGWRSSWQRSVNPVANGPVKYTREDGRTVKFLAVSAIDYSSDPDVVSRLVADGSGGWRVTRADDSVERYGADGRLLSITTRSGRVTTLTYDASNHLTTVTGPFGHTLRFAYTGELITQATGPDGGVYTYSYDARNNLRSLRYPDGATRAYVYENPILPNLLTGIVDELGVRFATYTYDQSGRVLTTQHAGGAELTTIAYNTDATSTVTDARGFVHSRSFSVQYGLAKPQALTGVVYPRAGGAAFTYDVNGFVASRTDWNGNVTSYTHDARGNETSRTDAALTPIARSTATSWLPTFNLPDQIVDSTKTTSFTYDGNGNTLTRTESAGGVSRTWRFTYSGVGQVLTSTDPNGNTTSFAYDAQGALERVTNALGQVTQLTANDANGRPTRIVDPNGLVTTLAYDARGRLTTRTVGGLVTAMSYDAAGNLASVTNPDGSRLTMTYDAAHRLTKVIDRLGNQIVYTLDASGNRTNVSVLGSTSVLSRTVSYAYDEANRVTTVTGALGQTTTYTRDRNGNVLSVRDPVGAVTSMTYDALNRNTSSTDALGGVTNLAYDPLDRLLSVIDPRRLTTSYTYNGFGDLLQIVSPDSGPTTRTVDANGNLLTSTEARGLTNTRTYDSLNRLTRIAFSSGQLDYQYDVGANAVGRLTRVSGTTDSTLFSYDVLGRLVTKQQTVGTSVLSESFAFNAAGQLATKTYPSGMQVGYQYNAAGQVAALTVNGGAFMSGVVHEPFGPARSWTWGTQTYLRPHDTDGRVTSFLLGNTTRTLSYDVASRITGYSDSTGLAQSFGYDLLARLTSYTSPTVGQTYGYDPDGNRTSLATGAGTDLYGIAATSNRLASRTSPATSYIYDPAGNLTASGTLSYSYDPLGRMTASLNGAARSARTLYTTNGLGQRLLKAGPAGTTTFLYGSGSQLMGEYTGASSQETIYLYGMPVGVSNNGTLLRIYADQLGAPRVITDATGAQLWKWDGDPFGNVAPTGTLTFSQRFPGQYADSETGLYFNHARYYDPKTGRYTQSDPIGLRGGLNAFGYASAGPIGRMDPLGLALIFVGGLFDETKGKQVKSFQEAFYGDANYYTWDQGDALLRFVNSLPVNEAITLVGHSYGGDTAAFVAARACRKVENLITIDPVSRVGVGSVFGPSYSDVAANTDRWTNINAVGGSASEMSNVVAGIGGYWGTGPRGYADYYAESNTTHANFWAMMFELGWGSQ